MTIWFEESIPLEKIKLTESLGSTFSSEDWKIFAHISQLLDAFCDREFQKILIQLLEYYQPFNPNTNITTTIDEVAELQYAQNLVDHFRRFLEQAQYQPIAEADIRDIIRQTRVDGIKLVLPPERYREFLLYYREREVTTLHQRNWRYFWLKRTSKVITSYKRLTLLFRPFRKNLVPPQMLQDPTIVDDWRAVLRAQPITIKLFQNIRGDSLPIILPGITIKTSTSSKLQLLGIFFVSCIVSGILAWTCDSFWYALLGLLPFSFMLYEIIMGELHHRAYYRNLLIQLYHKNVSNNSGVLSYLLDRISEETYKQNLIVLYALWKREEWAFGVIGLEDLRQYLQQFLLKYFGIKVKLNLENVIPKLMSSQNSNDYPASIMLINATSLPRAYLKQGFPEAGTYLDFEATTPPLPCMGIVQIASGTEQAEEIPFIRDEFFLSNTNPQGFEFSHSQGSAIRWILDKPIRVVLTQDCKMDSNILIVSSHDANLLPLQGIGKILLDEKNDKFIEFRFHRNCQDNHLSLDGGLRYRHCPDSTNPIILVRPILPRFVLGIEIPAKQGQIPIPSDVIFPQQGLIKLETLGQSQILPYQQEIPGILKLMQTYPDKLQIGTTISLTPPTTRLAEDVSSNSLRLPIIHNQFFENRGCLILDGNTESEERVTFRGEIWEIEIEQPLEFSHRRGGLVLLHGQVKSDIASDVSRGKKFLFVQGISSIVSQGKIVVDPGEYYQENCQFKIIHKYFNLITATQYPHEQGAEICQACLESPLRYEALQGSHLITVEDASKFPLSGTLEIHYNGTSGVKEVFAYIRNAGSNTLRLQTQIKQFIYQNTPILITAVEVASQNPYHYHEHGCYADFSCVPNFPQQGQIIIEPGSQNQETVHFQRHPCRIRLAKPMKYYHPPGTLADFSQYASCILKEPWRSQQNRIILDYQHLLPQQGSLVVCGPDGTSQVIWYRKKTNCLLLKQPCRYHHTQSTWVVFPTISSNVHLIVGVEKGECQLQVHGEQDLPIKGKLIIEGFLHTATVQFLREGNLLFLETPLEYSFSRHVRISLPEMYLNNHASPGQDYLEVVSASFAPETGYVLINPGSQLEERVEFQYRPDILWLDKPLSKDFPIGTTIYSPELWAKGTANLEIASMDKTRTLLQDILLSQHLQPNQTIANRTATFQNLHSITQNFLRQIPRSNESGI